MNHKNLYPLQFQPILKEKIWGGQKLFRQFHKGKNESLAIGESWEVSGIPGSVSIVTEGEFQGVDLTSLLLDFGEALVGKSVYKRFGDNFPILIKFLDANADLSVQVHPNDELSKLRHQCPGKTEMWYIMSSEKGRLNTGFKTGITKEDYLRALNKGKLEEILSYETVEAGESFFIPAGTVHAICEGIVLAEIQQTSDITYRLYDYNRIDSDGMARPLHTEQALDAIRFDQKVERLKPDQNEFLIDSTHFSTRELVISGQSKLDHSYLDSFVILICVNGSAHLEWKGRTYDLLKGSTILIPAALEEVIVSSAAGAVVLETFMNIE
jgi:mannose-6-phosphate isomerase